MKKEPKTKITVLQMRLAAQERVGHFTLISKWVIAKNKYFGLSVITKKKLNPKTKKIRTKSIKCLFPKTEMILANEIRQASSSERRYTKSKLIRRYREEVRHFFLNHTFINSMFVG